MWHGMVELRVKTLVTGAVCSHGHGEAGPNGDAAQVRPTANESFAPVLTVTGRDGRSGACTPTPTLLSIGLGGGTDRTSEPGEDGAAGIEHPQSIPSVTTDNTAASRLRE